MATVHIINPTFQKSSKTLRERLGKYKHRPVFYSTSESKLGARSEFKKLNPKKGGSSLMAKTKKKTYRAKKRSNPHGTKKAVKYRYGFRKGRKRRNPDNGSPISVSSAVHVVGGGIAGAVGYKVTTGLFQTEGNGKYIVAILFALGGGWLLSKFYRPLASPFAAGVAGAAAIEYLQESDILAGLLGQPAYTPQDIDVLQEWQRNYDTGVNGLGMVPEIPGLSGGMGLVPEGGIKMAPSEMYAGVAGSGGDKL